MKQKRNFKILVLATVFLTISFGYFFDSLKKSLWGFPINDVFYGKIFGEIQSGIIMKIGKASEPNINGDLTLLGTQITIQTSQSHGGAVTGLTWNGKQFINNYDHGRQIQVAWTIDGLGEVYNPTEAGSRSDSSAPKSTSEILKASSVYPVISTANHPAFWLGPGEKSYSLIPGQEGLLAVNTISVSPDTLSKRVTVDYLGNPHLIRWDTYITLVNQTKMIQIEIPTAYVNGEFTAFFTYNPANRKLTSLSHTVANQVGQFPPGSDVGEQSLPVIFATPSQNYAIGVWSPEKGVQYGRFDFTQYQNAAKWNAVVRRDNLNPGTYGFVSYVAVGTLQDVAAALQSAFEFSSTAASDIQADIFSSEIIAQGEELKFECLANQDNVGFWIFGEPTVLGNAAITPSAMSQANQRILCKTIPASRTINMSPGMHNVRLMACGKDGCAPYVSKFFQVKLKDFKLEASGVKADGTVDLKWEDISEEDFYIVQAKTEGQDFFETKALVSENQASTTISDLKPGTKYTFRVVGGTHQPSKRNVNSAADVSQFMPGCNILKWSGSSLEKLDIVFLGDRYDKNSLSKFKDDSNLFIQDLLYHEPFKSNKNKINFYYVTKNVESEEDLACQPEGRAYKCDYNKVREYAFLCPADEIMIVINTNEAKGASQWSYGTSALGASAAGVFVHEFGHLFGGLLDEYVNYQFSAPQIPWGPNCTPDTTCFQWKNLTDKCSRPCTFDGWSAPIKELPGGTFDTLMRDLGGGLTFDKISIDYMQKIFDKFYR